MANIVDRQKYREGKDLQNRGIKKEGNNVREGERERKRERGGEKGIQTYRQTSRQKEKGTYSETNGVTCVYTYR